MQMHREHFGVQYLGGARHRPSILAISRATAVVAVALESFTSVFAAIHPFSSANPGPDREAQTSLSPATSYSLSGGTPKCSQAS